MFYTSQRKCILWDQFLSAFNLWVLCIFLIDLFFKVLFICLFRDDSCFFASSLECCMLGFIASTILRA